MRVKVKAREQLISELVELRQRVAELEALETQRQRAEEGLRSWLEKYRTIVETANEGIWLLDADKRVTYANPKMAEMLGYAPEEMRGKPFFAFMDQEVQRHTREYLGQRHQGAKGRYETYLLRKDGTPVDIVVSTAPFLDEGGHYEGQVGIHMDISERKRTEEALKLSLEKLQATLEGTINALAATTEKRDPYTAGHQGRVAYLSCAVAKEMDLPEEQIDGIEMAALIHDIGKIAVPAEILSSPRRLSETEMNLIRTHPQVGHDIMKTIEFPWPVAQIVLQHHERIDGSGYPSGLSGEDIVVEARILAVADVVEAISSHRPYRPSHGIDKALEEVSQKSGILYDPCVVDACMKLFAEKGFKFK